MNTLFRRRPVEFRIADEPTDVAPELRAISFRPLRSAEPAAVGTPSERSPSPAHDTTDTVAAPRHTIHCRAAQPFARRRARTTREPGDAEHLAESWEQTEAHGLGDPDAGGAAGAERVAPPAALAAAAFPEGLDGEDPAALAVSSASAWATADPWPDVRERRAARPHLRPAAAVLATSALAAWALIAHGDGRPSHPADEPARPLPGLASTPHSPRNAHAARPTARARHAARHRSRRRPQRPAPARAARARAARTAQAARSATSSGTERRRVSTSRPPAPLARSAAHTTAPPRAATAPTQSTSGTEFGFEGTR